MKLRESGLHVRIAAKKRLQTYTNNKKRLAWANVSWGGALLVTLSVIYLEFKAHLTSMANTAFCIDTPSHLVFAEWDYNLFFNRSLTQHTYRLYKGYLTKKESD